MSRKKATLSELNGLRLVAILMLIYFHYFAMVKYFHPDFNAGIWQPILNFADFGFTGTGLFFILSGFILTYIYWVPGSNGMKVSGPKFFYLRLSRIYPLHFLFLAIFLAIIPKEAPFTLKQWWVHVGMLQSFFPHDAEAWNFPSWALSSLLVFYAAFPRLLALLSRCSQKQLLLIVGVAYAWVLGIDAVYLHLNPDHLTVYNAATRGFYLTIIKFSPIIWTAFFVSGVAAGIFFSRIQNSAPTFKFPWTDSLALALILIHVFGDRINYVYLRHGLLLPLQLSFIVFLCLQGSLVGRFLRHPRINAWGEASLTMYLFHIPAFVGFAVSPLMKERQLATLFFAYTAVMLIGSRVLDRWFVQPIAQKLRKLWDRYDVDKIGEFSPGKLTGNLTKPS